MTPAASPMPRPTSLLLTAAVPPRDWAAVVANLAEASCTCHLVELAPTLSASATLEACSAEMEDGRLEEGFGRRSAAPDASSATLILACAAEVRHFVPPSDFHRERPPDSSFL